MQKNILAWHDKISKSLAKSLKEGKIKEEDTLAYMIFFEALGENEELINNSVIKVGEADGIFTDLILEIKGDAKKVDDLEKAKDVLEMIKNNSI